VRRRVRVAAAGSTDLRFDCGHYSTGNVALLGGGLALWADVGSVDRGPRIGATERRLLACIADRQVGSKPSNITEFVRLLRAATSRAVRSGHAAPYPGATCLRSLLRSGGIVGNQGGVGLMGRLC